VIKISKKPDWMITKPLGKIKDDRPKECKSCDYDYYGDCQEGCMKDSPKSFFCPICCCEMNFLVNESGDGYYQCHCGYKEEF